MKSVVPAVGLVFIFIFIGVIALCFLSFDWPDTYAIYESDGEYRIVHKCGWLYRYDYYPCKTYEEAVHDLNHFDKSRWKLVPEKP